MNGIPNSLSTKRRAFAVGKADEAYKTYILYCERIGNVPQAFKDWLETSEIFPGYARPIGWDRV